MRGCSSECHIGFGVNAIVPQTHAENDKGLHPKLNPFSAIQVCHPIATSYTKSPGFFPFVNLLLNFERKFSKFIGNKSKLRRRKNLR